MTCVIALSRPQGYDGIIDRLRSRTGEDFVLLVGKAAVSFEKLKSLNPQFVFFPHWSHILPADIHENFACVIFHMTDLPFGRGGSPLQNLIARGITDTKISALRCVKEVDAGEVYLKRPLTLSGRADDIYRRAALIIEDMIAEIVLTRPTPQPQAGTVVSFARRKPEEGNLAPLSDPGKIYDFIRMLDADGYPRAFVTTDHFQIEFDNAEISNGEVTARAVFRKKEKPE